MTVAFDTWVWRNAYGVVVDIGLNNVAMKIFGEVKDQVINAQLLGDSTSVVNVAHAAATRVAVAAPEAHRDSDDFVTLFKQQGSRNRRINAARHRYKNLHGSRGYGDFVRPVFDSPHR